MPSAEIITIGTEILLGEIVDTNTRHIARTLRGMGVDLYRTITIGDNTERIAEAIHNSMNRAEIVITTGGLGPTVDDPTREAVARAAGVELEFREDLWEQVVAIISRYGRKPSENQKRQAYVPKGAIGISNPVGTAPCFIVQYSHLALSGAAGRVDGGIPSYRDPAETKRGEGQGVSDGVVISLPGVPSEMEYILHESIIPYLQKRFNLDQIIKIRILHCAGLGEGLIDEKIDDLEKLSNPTVGLAAHTGVVDIRIAAKAKNETEADEMIAGIEEEIRERLGDVVFGADEDKLETITLNEVAKRGWTLTAIESGLDGLLARRIPHTTSFSDLNPAALLVALHAARAESNADAALGVAVYPQERAAEIALITPKGEKTHHITYGGPPRSLPRWSVNLALDWLRRRAMDPEGD
ncbi:MAG: molybdopterin-binding protein [Anaerolineae bacterium]|nr:molybdopterin-binding protein [Anaerolineae bacterium]MCI0609218.1 molybdopterin-binding protein [Anaerolineae bacterium]